MAREFSSDAYDVHAVLETESFSAGSYDFTALFTEEAGNWTLLAAVRGAFERAKLVPTLKGYAVEGELSTDDGPQGTFVMQLSTATCDDLWLEKLEVIPGDDDGDGVIDHFSARGEGITRNPTRSPTSSGASAFPRLLDSVPLST